MACGGGSQPSQPAPQTTTTVQKSDPWAGQQGYLKDVFGQAQNLSQNPMSMYGGQPYAPQSGATQQAMNMQEQRALAGSPLVQQGQGAVSGILGGDYRSNPSFGQMNRTSSGGMLQSNPYSADLQKTASGELIGQNPNMAGLQKTASGGMLGSNPYLKEAFGRAGGQMQGMLSSQFGGSGRYGSGMHKASTGDALSGLANQMYGGQYAQERGAQQQAQNTLMGDYGRERGMQQQAQFGLGDMYNRGQQTQMQAAGMAPQMAQQDYGDIARLAEVGAAREDTAQQGINEAMQRHQYGQNEEWDRLNRYANLVQGTYGGQTTGTASQSVQPRSIGAGILGGASIGAGMGAPFGAWGTGAGAIAGGLIGGYG